MRSPACLDDLHSACRGDVYRTRLNSVGVDFNGVNELGCVTARAHQFGRTPQLSEQLVAREDGEWCWVQVTEYDAISGLVTMKPDLTTWSDGDEPDLVRHPCTCRCHH